MSEVFSKLAATVDTSIMMARTITEWRPVLANDCQVYAFGENYLAKRFDQINYKFCEKNEAKEILVDNLYALLRYKYFPKSTDEIDERITTIIKSFSVNLRTTLKKVTFDSDATGTTVSMLPDGCIAFKNGVYDFVHNKWLFKYNILNLSILNNVIYMYDPQYIITWYLNYDFYPLKLETDFKDIRDFIDKAKALSEAHRNYCFELAYNIAHDEHHKFSVERFTHLCEILGYTLLNSFSQSFVMLIGSGQNGKNSLFDGCFTNRLVPRPAANDLDAIENDRFITGSLENCSHNIFLETSAKTYTESKMIKALTGSMYQTIECKGVNKYSGVINCKYVFAGNDQDKIKFSDTTNGFRRRINLLEIYYQWDKRKTFLRHGDYYDTTFSDTLKELTSDVQNTSMYVYLGILGIFSATKSFTHNFQFTYNDWTPDYTDIDLPLREKIETITTVNLADKFELYEPKQKAMYDTDRKVLYKSPTLSPYSVGSQEDLVKFLVNEEEALSYFVDNDIYISMKFLQFITGLTLMSLTEFSWKVKKAFSIKSFARLVDNQSYIKVTFISGRLRILND